MRNGSPRSDPLMDKSTERVLVLPTARFHALGVFQGFCPHVAEYLPALLEPAHLHYLARILAETDLSFKQLIPYIVLRCRDQIFCYTRGSASGEARLRALRSLGIGGHICAEDGASSTDPYRAGLLRELEEEVFWDTTYTERIL